MHRYVLSIPQEYNFLIHTKNIFSPVRCTIIDLKIKMKDKAILFSCISLWTSFHLIILVHVLCRTSVSQILDFSMYHKASFSQVLCLLVLEQLRLRHYNITMVLSSTISPKVFTLLMDWKYELLVKYCKS